ASQKKHQKAGRKGIKIKEIAVPHYTTGRASGKALLDKIVGLDDVKKIIETEINRQAYRNRLMEELNRSGDLLEDYVPCRNMAFCGNPGTCKTTMARAMAVRMGELGVTNGTFLEVSREHLVGRYMGETSLKVAGIFEKARGGVLFIDEAGSLAGDGQDHYSEEAVSAIVRHMENERDTVVIFATYHGDMERLMAVNEGLRSRIGRMIQFADYTPAQLADIFRSMAASRGYHVEEGAETILVNYFKKVSERRDFGAGREARRLLDQAEGQMATFAMSQELTGAKLRLLTNQVIEEAAALLLGEAKEKRRTIGFAPRPTA
ncbi:MAG: AAA family ATPase, partial [Firmicutes bacterium]|nr:AAA family ATPase [Bacillota bacterium]